MNTSETTSPSTPAPPVEADPPTSGWMVLIRVGVYLVLLPAAILIAVRYLFDLVG